MGVSKICQVLPPPALTRIFLPQRDNVKPVAIRNDGQCQLCESVNALNIRLPRSRLKAYEWLETGSEKFRQVVILALVQR
jgi:hypothetical protein